MVELLEKKAPMDNVEILSISLVANPAFVPLDEEEKKKFQPALFHLAKSDKSNERLTAEILRAALLKEFDFDAAIAIEEYPINKSVLEVISKPAGATGWDKASGDSKYHRYRMKDPKLFSTCKIKAFDKNIKATFCQRKDDPKKWEQQNLMFKADKFTLSEAKAWVRTHKVTNKSVGTEFDLSNLDVDTLFIENREKWEVAYHDFQAMNKASQFNPGWKIEDYQIKYLMSSVDWSIDRVFSVELLDKSGSPLGIEFEEAYSAVDKTVRIVSVEFSLAKFTEETAKAWLTQHFKGDVTKMTTEEINALIEEKVKSFIEPLQASINTLTESVKKFQDGVESGVAPPPTATPDPVVPPVIGTTPAPTDNTVDVAKMVEKSVTERTAPIMTAVAELTTLVTTLTKGRPAAAGSQPAALPSTDEEKVPTIPVGSNHNAHVEYDPSNPSAFEIKVKSKYPLPPPQKGDQLLDFIADKVIEKQAAGGGA